MPENEYPASYWDQRDELSIDNGLLMKGSRIVIPTSQRERTLGNLHTGHPGVQQMTQNAKIAVYWPGINADIEDYCNRCMACLATKPNNAREPMKPHEMPHTPWEKIAADFCDANGKKFLVIVDYFSKFPFVFEMTKTTAQSTINKFKQLFHIQHSPAQLITDNGPPFNSAEFAKFCQDWNIEHITSSPHTSWSNGQAESFVKKVKQMMLRCEKDKQDWEQGLQMMRATPISPDLPSPAEILQGRPARTINGQAPQKTLDFVDIRKKLIARQKNQKQQYDRRHGVHELPPLHLKQNVLIQHKDGNWELATITQIGPEPRSYLCKTVTGKTLRRNRKHIRITG